MRRSHEHKNKPYLNCGNGKSGLGTYRNKTDIQKIIVENIMLCRMLQDIDMNYDIV